ncbi:L-2-amino-thiazoline-4-carboxylic acid hydrolase [Candidatus Bipolaricaulota bacterium]
MLDVKAYRAWDESAVTDVVAPNLVSAGCRALEEYLEFVSVCEADALNRFVERLQVRWEEINESLPHLAPSAVPSAPADSAWVQRTPRIYAAYLAFMSRCVQISRGDWGSTVPIKVLQTQLAQASYLPRYLILKALVDVLDRDQGIERMKQFLDERIARRPKPKAPPKTLRELRERDIPWNEKDGGQNAISALMSEHQCLKKVTACRIQKVLAPYRDADLMEVIACYPDFASIRRTNEHFVLTRTRNLIQGGDYCDTCFHDDRGESEIVHPTRDVFDGLGASCSA